MFFLLKNVNMEDDDVWSIIKKDGMFYNAFSVTNMNFSISFIIILIHSTLELFFRAYWSVG